VVEYFLECCSLNLEENSYFPGIRSQKEADKSLGPGFILGKEKFSYIFKFYSGFRLLEN
jgi:hypothetical protein